MTYTSKPASQYANDSGSTIEILKDGEVIGRVSVVPDGENGTLYLSVEPKDDSTFPLGWVEVQDRNNMDVTRLDSGLF